MLKIFFWVFFALIIFGKVNDFASAATVVCDTTSSLTIPGAQNPYSMNFNCGVPAGATASLEIKYTAVGDNDGRDFFTCGGSTLYTTSGLTAPFPRIVTTDVSTCLRGYTLATGNRLCTANAWNSNCGGYYYGLAAGHSTMEYARLTVTYADGPPVVNAFSPTDNSTTFNMADNLVISFDRAAYVGAGNITIKKTSDNSVVEAIDVTSGQVVGSGTPTITINPSVDLVKNTAYYVQIDATAFNDNNGNNYAGISNTTSWNFTTLNIIPPTTQAANLTFSSVTSNSLTLGWTNGNGAGRMVFAKQANSGTAAPVDYTNYTANAAFGSGSQIGSSGWYAIYSGTGTSVAITNLSAETNYIFQVIEYNTTSGAKAYFTDAASNNPNVAFITSTVYDTTSSMTIPGAQNPYSMNFNCGVPTGATASLEIKWTSVGDRDGRDYFTCGGSTLYTTSGIGSPLPAVMTTDVSSCLRGYNLATGNRICTNNAWSGSCGGYYYGLAAGHSTMEYARLTVTYAKGPPVATSFSPADNLTTASATGNLQIYFDRPTYAGTGNITIKKGSDNSTVETIDVTSGQVTGGGTSVITIDPSITLDSDTAYYVQIDSTAFNDNSGNNYAGINNTTTWNFTTIDSTPPTVQANTLAFSSVTYNSLNLGWSNGNGDGRIVFAKAANSGTASPVDNTNYTASSTFGSGTQIGSTGWYAIYKGTGTSVSVSGLSATTDYIFQVLEYDLSGSNPLFLTDSASSNPNTQTTAAVNEPTTQATNLTFSSVSYTSMTVSWTSGNGARRKVFAKQANTGTANPVDDTSYTANSAFGSGTQIESSGWYNVYDGTGSSVSVSGLTAGTDYIFQVFEYNSNGAIYNYNVNTGTNNPRSQATSSVIAPTTQATNITFSSVAATSMNVSWTSGNGSRRVVFVKQANTGSATPVDDATYTASTTFGSGTQIGTSGWYCVYNNTGTAVSISGLTANTDYIVQVFDYNYSGSTYRYNVNTGTNNPKYQTTLASEPTMQASSVTFSSVAYDSLTASWTNGNGSSRVVFMRAASSGSATPVDITTYTASTTFGSGTQISSTGWYCIYNGTGNSVSVTGLSAGTAYRIQVFEYNGVAGAQNYFTNTATNNPNSQTTLASYTLTYTAGSHGTITGISPQTVSSGSTGSAVTAVPDANYHFVNWSDSSTANPRTDSNVAANVSVTANFAIDTHTLTYVAGSHGTISGISPQTVNHSASGSAVTAVPDAGYAFVNWDDGILTAVRTDSNVTVDHTYTASFVASSFTLTYSADDGGSISGTSPQTVGAGLDGSAVTAIPNAGYSFVEWSDHSTDNPRTDTNVSENISVTANFEDSQDPAVEDISAEPSETSADISWTTNESSSSKVEYGLTDALGSETGEEDTGGDRTTDHEMTLTGLKSCARYYYLVESKDASNNITTSEKYNFATAGCIASSISSGSGNDVEVSGGFVSLNTDGGSAALTMPDGYYSESASVQINKLDASSAPSSVSGQDLVNDNFFDLLAVSQSGEVIPEFDEPVTFTINYGSGIESSFIESTLDIYKYDGSSWVDKNCVLDVTANTLTCTLNSFSVYGIMGERLAVVSGDEESNEDDDDEDVEIEDVEYATENNSIIIEWETDKKADSKVRYGTNKYILKNKKINKEKEKKHRIVLKDLEPDTKYFFKIYSEKNDGNRDVSKKYSLITSNDVKVIEDEKINESEPILIYDGDAKPNSCSYVVEEGDNLWSIAKKIYGDATAYPLIIESNKGKYPEISDLKIDVGQKLVFRCVSEENSVPKNKNESESKKTEKEKTFWDKFLNFFKE